MSESIFEEYQQRVSERLDSLADQNREDWKAMAPEEWGQLFVQWVASHRDLGFPFLSDDAIGREHLYENR